MSNVATYDGWRIDPTAGKTRRMVDEHADPGPDEDFGTNVLKSLSEVFLTPEIERRGGPEVVGPIRKAVVLLEPGVPARVLLNEQADVAASVRVTRAVEAGEELYDDDVDHVQDVRPLDVPEDAGWVALVALPDGNVVVGFDFRRNRGRGRQLLALAQEYCSVSHSAAAAGRSGPCLDLAHTAAELAVTAMMYLTDDDPLSGPANERHRRRTRWLRGFTSHGNAPTELHLAMARLSEVRPAARYGSPPLDIADDERDALVDAVARLVDHAAARVGEPLPPLPDPAALLRPRGPG